MLLQGKTIFVVEDNMLNRVTYQLALIQEGAYIVFERWGHSTLFGLRSQKQVDLIILDLMLPRGESGYHLFAQIRSVPQFSQIPIIAVSAAEPSEAMARCRDLGFNGYIAKPINEQTFASQLLRIIEGEVLWSIHS